MYQHLTLSNISIAARHFVAYTTPHVAEMKDFVRAMPQTASSETNYGEMNGQRTLTEGTDREKKGRRTGRLGLLQCRLFAVNNAK